MPESFDQNWQNGGCFSKISGTQKYIVLILVPPSRYDLNLKTLNEVSKLAEHFSFHMKYFDLDLKEKSERKNFISSKKTPGLFRVKGQTNSKWFFKKTNLASKKQTNKFDITTCRLVLFVFWKKLKTHYKINWPLTRPLLEFLLKLARKKKSWFIKLRDIPMSKNGNSPIFCSNWPIQRFKIRPTSNLINPKRI